MTLFVDTSAWSLAFSRDQASTSREVSMSRHALEGGATIVVESSEIASILMRTT